MLEGEELTRLEQRGLTGFDRFIAQARERTQVHDASRQSIITLRAEAVTEIALGFCGSNHLRHHTSAD
jgi:hypothetical protein